MVTEEACVPVAGADAQAATLGEVGQVLLGHPHVLVDLVQALLHILQLLWNTRGTPPSHTSSDCASSPSNRSFSLYLAVGLIQPNKGKLMETFRSRSKVRGGASEARR